LLTRRTPTEELQAPLTTALNIALGRYQIAHKLITENNQHMATVMEYLYPNEGEREDAAGGSTKGI
jgi:hypothetical protein